MVTLTTGCGLAVFQAVAGSGTVKRESRDVADFTSVEVSGVVHATVHIGPRAPVVLEGDDNLLPLITTEVHDGRLVVAVKNGANIRPSRPIKAEITTPVLSGITANGASEMDVTAATTDKFSVAASGATAVAVRDVDTEALAVDASGASRVTLAGKARSTTLGISGASHIKADGLTAGSAAVEISGASHVEISATAAIKGTVSGASHLDVLGSPRDRSVASSGASHVSYKASAAPAGTSAP
jgi:hypothetical protein